MPKDKEEIPQIPVPEKVPTESLNPRQAPKE